MGQVYESVAPAREMVVVAITPDLGVGYSSRCLGTLVESPKLLPRSVSRLPWSLSWCVGRTAKAIALVRGSGRRGYCLGRWFGLSSPSPWYVGRVAKIVALVSGSVY